MPEQEKPMRFLTQKRNLISLSVWCALVLALLVGITLNAVAFANGSMKDSEVFRRLWYTLLCFVAISAVFVAEKLLRVRLPLFLELSLPLFAFAALAVGTVFGLYSVLDSWDKILHALFAFLFTALGCSLAEFFLRGMPDGMRKIIFTLLFAVGFTLMLGCLWELLEFLVAQIIPSLSPIWQKVFQYLPNGTYILNDPNGAALSDLIWDMACNCFGVLAFLCTFGFALLSVPKRLSLFAVESVGWKKAPSGTSAKKET